MDRKVLSLLHKLTQQQIPKILAHLDQIRFSKAKITGFEKTSFEFTVSKILKINLTLKSQDSNSVKNRTTIFFTEF